MLLAWDVWLSGDGSREGVVEHYHSAHCPGDESCRQLVVSEGIGVMLARAPPKYNRRDYHGHRSCVDHVCLLQACAGGLFRFLPPAVAKGRLLQGRGGGAPRGLQPLTGHRAAVGAAHDARPRGHAHDQQCTLPS